MGTRKKMVNAVPTSLCYALMRPEKNKTKLHLFNARPIIWSCHLSVKASKQFVTTIPYHYVPNSWSSISRWVLNILWSILIVMCMYVLFSEILYISVWTSCAKVLLFSSWRVFKHNLILFLSLIVSFFFKKSIIHRMNRIYGGKTEKKGRCLLYSTSRRPWSCFTMNLAYFEEAERSQWMCEELKEQKRRKRKGRRKARDEIRSKTQTLVFDSRWRTGMPTQNRGTNKQKLWLRHYHVCAM